jgi:molybdopterin-guanine dinucleotide biosynthesis protein A
MNQDRQVAGVVLAGGLSRRMGGGDKTLLDLGGRSMLARVIERLAPQACALAINANGDPSRFAPFGLPVLADPVGGFVGPLAGVLAGMRWASAAVPGASHIVTVSGDAPFIPTDLVPRLRTGLSEGCAGIAIARSNADLHPVIGLWPVRLADDLEAAITGGTRKVLAWTDRHGTWPVDFPMLRIGEEAVDPFLNANTPEELDEARRLLARMPP